MGFLSRLARDVRGNTLAIMAAALLPLAGLIGGGVDMSRLYLVKTRLQQACDAGALAGRKAMGAGTWSTGSNNGSTNDKAEKMFAANFASGQYGSSGLTKSFTENNGIVSGSAGLTVPMTIMKVFGMQSRTTSVTCQAKMELPNTDVMFVLDVTYSMQCAPSATSDNCTPPSNVNGRRITGLKKAVKCFYEALMKVSTSEPCHFVSNNNTPNDTSDDVYNSIGDPTATSASTTAQVRIGFVPYGVNVNVGKILPNNVMADDWTYQTRVANKYGPLYGWTLGTETPAPASITNWGAWSSAPSGLNTLNAGTAYTSGFTLITSNNAPSPLNNPRYTSDTNTTNCQTNRNTNNGAVGYIDTPSVQSPVLQSTTNNPPTHPAASQTLTYSQSDNHTAVAYKYVYVSGANNGQKCQLQQSTKTYTLTRANGTTTKAITWTTYTDAFKDWTYKAASVDVSGLKAGGSSWNNSIAVPEQALTGSTSVKLSGSSSSTTLQFLTTQTVTWDGCIEEAQTVANSDQDPSDEWSTLPANAYDMNVNLIPNGSSTNPDWGSAVASTLPTYSSSGPTYSPGTFWGPDLADGTSGIVWARYTGSTTSDWTRSDVTTTTTLSRSNFSYICTTSPARKLTQYTTSSNFTSYVDALDAQDYGTQHDIGLLWGGRLISPLGIFASENAAASTGGAIQRHLIFMTDGNTRTVYNNYDAYGLGFFNRYKTTYDPTCPGASPYTCTYTDALVNARLLKICDQIKNMNIQLWVVSYGSAINTTTEDRLRSCATDSQHFFAATDTATLNANFQTIAAKISALRLTG